MLYINWQNIWVVFAFKSKKKKRFKTFIFVLNMNKDTLITHTNKLTFHRKEMLNGREID